MADKFCSHCGAPLDTAAPPNFCPSCGAPLAPQSPGPNKGLIAGIVIAAALVLIILIGIGVWAITRSKDEPTPTPVPTSGSPSPSTGWSTDPAALNMTVPAKSGFQHGCLAAPVTLSNGTGTGSGVIGNGDAAKINVTAVSSPLQGAQAAGDPQSTVIALSCVSASDPLPGSMIDLAVLNASGQLMPMTPEDVFGAVVAATHSTDPEYFPIFDPSSLKLAADNGVPTFTGSTDPSQGKVYSFKIGIHPQASGQVSLDVSVTG